MSDLLLPTTISLTQAPPITIIITTILPVATVSTIPPSTSTIPPHNLSPQEPPSRNHPIPPIASTIPPQYFRPQEPPQRNHHAKLIVCVLEAVVRLK